jgi:hypothetical protein
MYDNKTNNENIRSCSLQLHEQGTNLFTGPPGDPNPLAYPYTLGLALIAAAEICDIASSHNNSDLASLFDGGEDRGPNLHTRMRCVRDLCSAAVWPISLRDEQSLGDRHDEPTADSVKPTAEFWRRIIAQFANTSQPGAVSELSALLDDTMESLISISQLLKNCELNGGYEWAEIQRQTEHVRDHFDYAEEMLIASLWPASEA